MFVDTGYCYVEPTVIDFPWKNHKYKSLVERSRVTINQNLRIKIEDNNIACFSFNRNQQSMANLNAIQVNDKFNSGPYMDIVLSSFKPLDNNYDFESNSIPPTPINENTFTYQNTRSTTIDPSSSIKIGKGGAVEGNIGPKVSIVRSQSSTTSCKRLEFQERQYQEGKKEIISLQMDTCYEGNQAFYYNMHDLSSLRCSNLCKRISLGVVPLYGWFGGFLHFPDTVYSPPTCATSSLGKDWTLKYRFKEQPESRFEWSTEVRTVFASNDSKVPKGNGMGTYLNWVKTIHKTTLIFKVFASQNELKFIPESRKEIKCCLIGYEDTVTKIIFRKQENGGGWHRMLSTHEDARGFMQIS